MGKTIEEHNARAERYRELISLYKNSPDSDAGFLLTLLRDYENAITWDTNCLNCSNLLDQLYAQDERIDQIRQILKEELGDD